MDREERKVVAKIVVAVIVILAAIAFVGEFYIKY